jgi:hypothetical protein
VCQAEWARAQSVERDHRQRIADVVQRPGKRPGAPDEPAVARDPRGRDEHEPPDPLGLPGRQLRGGEAAERVARDIDAFELGRVEPAAEPLAQLLRPAKPAQ